MILWATTTKLLTIAIFASLACANQQSDDGVATRRALSASATRVHNISKQKSITIIDAIEEIIEQENEVTEKMKADKIESDLADSFVPQQENQSFVKVAEHERVKQRAPRAGIRMWLKVNRDKILNGLLVVIGFMLFALITYKYYSINLSIKQQRAEIQSYANQLETIIEGSDKLVFATWKDQRENIRFIDNPAYKKKTENELTKVQQIEAEIANVEEDIRKKTKDVENLREKETYYAKEIETLETELAEAKTRVLDEGAALGFAETVLREFK